MNPEDHDHSAAKPASAEPRTNTRRLRWGWVFFSALALFYLLTEHRAHFFGILPYLLLLACPLMHLFMHHGHHGPGHHHDDKTGEARNDRP